MIKKTKKNMEKAIDILWNKGYDSYEAELMAEKAFENAKLNGRDVEYFLDMILPYEQWINEYEGAW